MMHKADRSPQDPGCAVLRDYCLRVIRFLASTALDPHRYFEQKYCGDVSVAGSRAALHDILITLSDWCLEAEISAATLVPFDRALSEGGLPSLSMLCDVNTREAGLVLANGRIDTAADARIVSEYLRATESTAADRRLAELRMDDYEQR